MSKIINIQDHRLEYKQQVQETLDYLESVRDELFTHMINIASRGVWKTWMQEIQTGDTFRFSYDMLENTGDKNVEALWELYYKMEEAEGRLEEGR